MFKNVKKAPDKRLKVLCLEEKIKCLKIRIEETYPAENKCWTNQRYYKALKEFVSKERCEKDRYHIACLGILRMPSAVR